MSFTMRTSCPNNNNYFIRQINGGWNGAIKGNPTRNGADVLSNCVRICKWKICRNYWQK